MACVTERLEYALPVTSKSCLSDKFRICEHLICVTNGIYALTGESWHGRPANRFGGERVLGVISVGEGGMKLISRPLTAVLAIAGAAVLVSSLALASTSRSAAARPAGAAAPACVNAPPALAGGALVWASLPGDGFAGGAGYILEITNEGRSACTVRGVPGAAFQDSDGHLVGGEVPASGRGPAVTLKPGGTAYFSLVIHDAGALCAHPVSGEAVIYLPGQQRAQDSQLAARGCPGLPGGGVLSPGPVKPGAGIPLYSA